MITNSPDANTPALMTVRVLFVEDPADPPFGSGARDYYCAAANSMAKTIFVATEGKHRITKVHFFRDFSAGRTDFDWIRGPNDRFQKAFVQGSCSSHGLTTPVRMGDWAVFDRSSVGGCDMDGDLMVDSEEALLTDDGEGRCVNSSGEFVLLQPWALGRIMAHELGHYFYGLNRAPGMVGTTPLRWF